MKRFAYRLLLATAFAALALYPLYLVAGNWLLRSGEIERRLNRRPERLLIQARKAWTVWPGVIHVEGFEIRNQTRVSQWWAAMDRGTFELRLLDLRDRELQITGLTGQGVSFRLRRRVDVPTWVRKPRQELQPAIPGLENPPRRPPEVVYPKPPAAARQRDPWRIRLAGIQLANVREIWVEEYHFAGEARIAGGFDLQVWKRTHVEPTRLQIESGDLYLGPKAGAPILAGMSGRIDGEISPYSPAEHRGWNAIRFLSGRARMTGGVASLAFLDEYMQRTRWLKLDAEQGLLNADLRLRRGQVMAGSRLEARPERLAASFLDYRAEGTGLARWSIPEGEGDEARLLLDFEEFRVERRGYGKPHVVGKGLRVEAAGSEPRILGQRDLFSPRSVKIEVPWSDVPRLAFYNAYLPQRSGMELTGGSGRIRSRFQAAAPEWIGSGDIHLIAKQVGARFENRPMRGDLDVHTRLRRADLREKHFDVSGTKLNLTNARMAGPMGGEVWWARAHLDRAVITPGAPVFLRARVESTLSDTRPLFAFMSPESQRGRMLRWVDDLLDVRGVGAVADVAVGDGAVAIDRLAISGGKASVQGRLRFGNDAAKRGVLYATYGRWDVGLEMEGEKRDWKILRPKRWFEESYGAF